MIIQINPSSQRYEQKHEGLVCAKPNQHILANISGQGIPLTDGGEIWSQMSNIMALINWEMLLEIQRYRSEQTPWFGWSDM